jgi:hypothetical protein
MALGKNGKLGISALAKMIGLSTPRSKYLYQTESMIEVGNVPSRSLVGPQFFSVRRRAR